MFVLNKCCGFVELRLGAILIFIYLSINYVLAILSVFIPSLSIIEFKFNDGTIGKVFFIIFCLLALGVSLFALYGLYKKNSHRHLVPWLGYMLFLLGCAIIVLIGSIFTFFDGLEIVGFLYELFSIALLSYFWLCIYSLYREMQAKYERTINEPQLHNLQV